MGKLYQIYRKSMRYSTYILGAVTLVLGIYVVINWPSTYYEVQCSKPAEVTFSAQYSNAYDCDTDMINVMQNGGSQCLKAVCRLVEE